MSNRKTCKHCGLEDAPHGRNRSNKDGLAYWCLMCMRESRLNQRSANDKGYWKEYNRRRRTRPGYREAEKKRAGQLDTERRKRDPDYVWTRSESDRKKKAKYTQERKDQINARRRELYQIKRALLTEEEKAARKQRQKDGWKKWQRYNDLIFAKTNRIHGFLH